MTLPKGSTVIVHYYSTFRSPWIRQSEDFIPDRWLSSDPQADELKGLLFPFSLGQRGCIGQNLANLQLRVIVGTLLRYYSLELPDGKDFEPEYAYFLTLKVTKFLVRVTKRG